jgi:hypothetical protein
MQSKRRSDDNPEKRNNARVGAAGGCPPDLGAT